MVIFSMEMASLDFDKPDMKVFYYEDTIPIPNNLIKVIRKKKYEEIIFNNPDFNSSIDNLPDCVKSIIFHSEAKEQSSHADGKSDMRPSEFTLWQGKGALCPSESKFNQPIIKFPSALENIEFGECFNQEICNLPNSIVKIAFPEESKFNQPVNKLNQNLVCLILGNLFNQPVDNLPSNLMSLELGDNFNQTIDNLPPELQSLQLGEKFNQPINKLPKELSFLNIGKEFNQTFENLPETLEHVFWNGGNKVLVPKELESIIHVINF